MRPTTFKVGNTIYWTIRTYTDAGVLVDADSNPSVAVRKNQNSTGDLVTVAKRAATTGIYDCEYNPSGETEGDCFTLEESATLSTQAYENSWSLEAQASERGTDGANTVAPVDVSSDVTAILSDTNELQQNQGDWATATGFNTVAPDNVSIAAILADTNELQGNQGDWVTATGFNTVAPDNASIAAILADTDELQQNQGDWATATGFNTVAPDNASIAAILLDTDELQGNQGDWATATTVVASNMRGTDNALLASSAPANWSIMSVNGAGAITTSNPASGGGSAHTAQDVVDLILVTPSNKLATDASGNVEASNMRGTDGANTIAPATPANVTAVQSALETRFTNVDNDNHAISIVVDDTSANVISVLSDTNDLVSTKGERVTATGFVTPSQLNAAVAPLLTETDFLDELPDNFASLDITSAGLVTASNVTAPDSKEEIFLYFDNQDLANFKADVTGLALEQTVTDGITQIITTGNADWVTGSGGGGSGGLQEGVDYVWTNVATGNSDTVRITQ